MHRRNFLKALGGAAVALGSATKIVEALALEPLPIAKEPWGDAFVLEVFHNNEWKSVLGVANLTLMNDPIEITSPESEFREFVDGSYSAEINGWLPSSKDGEEVQQLLLEIFLLKRSAKMRMATMTDGIIFENANIISYDMTVSQFRPTMAKIEWSFDKYLTTKLED